MNMQGTKPEWAMNARQRAIAAGETPKRRTWPWIVLAVFIAAGGAGGFYAYDQGLIPPPPAPEETLAEATPEPPAEPVVQIAPYEVETIAPGRLTDTLRVTGSLAPARQVHISAEVSAIVHEVNGRPGETVTQGDLLARFDVDTLENQLAQARATADSTRVQLEKARSDMERTETLVARELAAPTALQAAESGFKQLEAQLSAQLTSVATAEAALAKARVAAPFTGVVADRNVEPGEFVGAGTPLFTLVDLASLEVEAAVPVSLSGLLAPGQSVSLQVEGFGDRIFPGQVERISPLAMSGTRMLPVYVSLDNPSGALRGGMFATGQIVLAETNTAISVPVEALREDAAGPFVLVIEGDVLTRRSVEPVRDWDNGTRIELAGGLAPGDMILAAALPELSAGQKIERTE